LVLRGTPAARLTWTAAVSLLDSKSHKSKAGARRIALPRHAAEPRRYKFIIPTPTWGSEAFNPALSVVSPRSELQLDPRTHTDIVNLLTDHNTSGFGDVFVTFDEKDAFSRLADDGNSYFDGLVDTESDLLKPKEKDHECPHHASGRTSQK
jgi:hypothetical protein